MAAQNVQATVGLLGSGLPPPGTGDFVPPPPRNSHSPPAAGRIRRKWQSATSERTRIAGPAGDRTPALSVGIPSRSAGCSPAEESSLPTAAVPNGPSSAHFYTQTTCFSRRD